MKFSSIKNLLAACNGGEKDTNYKPRVLHCDSAKGNKNPQTVGIISPLDANCVSHFLFLENGKISHKTTLGETTIQALNLNAKGLVLNRKAAIDTYLLVLKDFDFECEIAQLHQPQNGELQAFCGAIIQILKAYIK